MESQKTSRRKEVPTAVREIMIQHYKDIGEIVGRSHATVQTIIQNYEQTGSVKSRPRSGRQKISTNREETLIVRKIKQNSRLSAPQIAAEMLQETGKVCSRFKDEGVL